MKRRQKADRRVPASACVLSVAEMSNRIRKVREGLWATNCVANNRFRKWLLQCPMQLIDPGPPADRPGGLATLIRARCAAPVRRAMTPDELDVVAVARWGLGMARAIKRALWGTVGIMGLLLKNSPSGNGKL